MRNVTVLVGQLLFRRFCHPAQWRGLKASGGCKSPDDCHSGTKNQGTYVPRSPNEFLKSTPLVSPPTGTTASTTDTGQCGPRRSGSQPRVSELTAFQWNQKRGHTTLCWFKRRSTFGPATNIARGFVQHVRNRGHGRGDVFHKDGDFAARVNLMREAHEK